MLFQLTLLPLLVLFLLNPTATNVPNYSTTSDGISAPASFSDTANLVPDSIMTIMILMITSSELFIAFQPH